MLILNDSTAYVMFLTRSAETAECASQDSGGVIGRHLMEWHGLDMNLNKHGLRIKKNMIAVNLTKDWPLTQLILEKGFM